MESNQKFSRRNLLRLAAGTGVAFSVLGLAACGPAATPTPVPATAKPAAAATTGTSSGAATATTGTATGAATATTGTSSGAATATTGTATGAATATTGTAAATTPAAKPASSSAAGTVRWQNRNNDVQQKDFVAHFADVFAKQYPNIKVTIEPAPDGRDEKLVTAMVGGNAPDIFESWSDNVTQYADRGQVLDCEPLSKRDYTAEDLKDFFAWQWNDFMIPTAQGTKIRFGVPKYVNVMVLWYNKDKFDAAGQAYPTDTWTHDDYAAAAKKLTKWNGNTPEQFGLHYPVWSWDRFWYKLETFGGMTVDPNDNTKAVFDSDAAMAAWEWVRKGIWDDKSFAQRLLMLGTGTTYDVNALFAAGKFAMNEDGFYPYNMATNIKKQFKWAWAHTPLGPTGKRRVLGTTDGWVEWKNSKVQDAAWEVMKYLAGKDFQLVQTKSTLSLPIRFSTLAEWKKICIAAYPELADANLDVGTKAMEMGYAGNRQLFKKDAESRLILVPALEKVFVTGNTPVTYFKDIAAQITTKNRAT